MPRIAISIEIGSKYGDLTVVRSKRVWSASENQFRLKWLCRCICNKCIWTDARSLRRKHTRSCGCLQRRVARKLFFKHGKKHTVEYTAWCNMIARCGNRHKREYSYYGGRGITVFSEWRNDFTKFLAYIGKSPGKGYSVDRIDNDKGYFPGNVRWATILEQNRNTRVTIRLTYKGQTKSLGDWSDQLNIRISTLHYRIKAGWSVEDALTTPVKSICKV